MGGAIVTAAVRRLALGQPLPSSRHYIDVEAILSHQSQAENLQNDSSIANFHERNSDELQAGYHTCFPNSFVLSWRMASLPLPRVTVSLKMSYEHDELWVIHDKQRSKNLLDGDHRAAYIALGAAVKNITIAAAHRGYQTQIKPFPLSGHRFRSAQHETVASLSFLGG